MRERRVVVTVKEAQRAALSNTAPSNRKSSFSDDLLSEMSGARVLLSNLDTLYVNLTCAIDEGMLAYFDALLAAMRDEETIVPEPSGVYFHGEVLYLDGFSSRRWRCQLRNELLTIQFARPGGVTSTTARIRVSSAYLHQASPVATLEAVQAWAFGVFGPDAVLQVSEVHLCRDVAGVRVGEAWSELSSRFVMRARSIRTKQKEIECDTSERNIGGRMVVQTAMFGARGGALSAELYNKLDEIKHSGKTWFHDLYSRAGWDGSAQVWRLEFRIRRDFLREAGIDSTADLAEKLNGLWLYCCDWLRHVDCAADADKDTRSRAALSSWWSVYVSEFVCELAYQQVTRQARRQYDVDRLWAQSIGCLSKALASGLDGSVLSDLGVTRAVVDRLHWYLSRKEMSWASLLDLKQRQVAVGQ